MYLRLIRSALILTILFNLENSSSNTLEKECKKSSKYPALKEINRNIKSMEAQCLKREIKGSCYLSGLHYLRGGFYDLKKSKYYFKRGCNFEDLNSCFRLGLIYQKKNKNKFKSILSNACNKGHNKSCEWLKKRKRKLDE